MSMNHNISAQPQYSIPSRVKNTAKSWSDGKISDSDYIQGLQWLIDHKILKIPKVTTVQNKTKITNISKVPTSAKIQNSTSQNKTKITNTPKVPTSAKIQNSTSQKPNLPTIYVNKAYGFSIIQPNGWTKKETIDAYSGNGNIVLFTSPTQKSGNVLSINIDIKTFTDIQSTSISQIESGFENGLRTTFAGQDYSFTRTSTMTVNGQKAFYLEYGVGAGTSMMNSKQVVIPHQDKLFIITYTTGQADYNQHMNQFTKILSSFKFS